MNTLSSILKFIAQGGLWSLTYPVGSYYETSNTAFDPNVSWGGTWVLDSQGKVTVSAGTDGSKTYTVGESGGNKDAIVPYHNHSVGSVSIGSSGGHTHTITAKYENDATHSGSGARYYGTATKTSTNMASIANGTGTHTHTVPSHNTAYAGTSGNLTDANMQPYIVVNRWHRTA